MRWHVAFEIARCRALCFLFRVGADDNGNDLRDFDRLQSLVTERAVLVTEHHRHSRLAAMRPQRASTLAVLASSKARNRR